MAKTTVTLLDSVGANVHPGATLHGPAIPPSSNPVGTGSVTSTLVAVDGPAFLTVSVYSTMVPASAVAGPVLVIETSADVAIGTANVLELLVRSGSGISGGGVTAAVFWSGPAGVPGGSWPVTVKRTDEFGAIVTSAFNG